MKLPFWVKNNLSKESQFSPHLLFFYFDLFENVLNTHYTYMYMQDFVE